METSIEGSSPTTRLIWLGAFFGLVLFSFIARLWALQVADWGAYAERAQRTRMTTVYKAAPRGLVFDRNGEVLIDNQYVWHIELVPNQLPSDQEQLEREIAILAGILGNRSAAELRGHFEKTRSQRLQTQVLPGSEDIPFEVVAHVEERKHELPGVRIGETARRAYPNGTLAAHALGYARAISAEQYATYKYFRYPEGPTNQTSARPEGIGLQPVYRSDSIVGQEGVERLCELDTDSAPAVPILQGKMGRTVYEVDVHNNPTRVIYEEEPVPGASVYLTLDTSVQRVCEEALARAVQTTTGVDGAAVCVDLATGGVLALASYPPYDPGGYVRGWTDQEYQGLMNSKRKPLFNKALGGAYAPASTFKMVSATAALETTDISLEKTYNCTGVVYAGDDRKPYQCWKRPHEGGHGPMNFYQGIAHSCDVYFYQLVLKEGLSSTVIGDYAKLFGFGELTGLGLTSEHPGLVPSPEWKAERKGEGWWTGDSLNMVIGQGFLQANPLQVAMATGVVATDGDLLQPQLVRKIAWPAHTGRPDRLIHKRMRRHLELKPETLERVRRGMRLAVTASDGTAKLFQGCPFTVAAKTGSAEHDKRLRTHAWITAFAPYEKPRFVAVAIIAEGGYGSETAGPVVKQVLEAAMAASKTGPETSPNQ